MSAKSQQENCNKIEQTNANIYSNSNYNDIQLS